MRDLFRFLYRIRVTLMFLGLLVLSFTLLYSGNAHHRSQGISSSNAMVGVVYTWRKEVTDYANLKAVNRQLAAENADWRNRHVSSFATKEARIAFVADSIRKQEYRAISAKVVNSTWHKPKNYITLDKGALAGLHPDRGVIGSQGIVGVVNAVSPNFASVISVLNPDIKHSVQLRRTDHFGLLYWNTNDPRTSSVIDVPKHARVAEGDTVETRGGDDTFPAGIPVGVVLSVEDEPGSNYHGITIRLIEDMTRSGFVYVVEDLLRYERDSLQQASQRP